MPVPQQSLKTLPDEFTRETVNSLIELNSLGKPKTDAEVEERINDYFRFCADKGIRPGIESLALSLHVSRITIYKWGKGIGCSPRCQEAVNMAQSIVATFLEQSMVKGKINPASGIFLMKNWLSYKDAISFEDVSAAGSNTLGKVQTAEEIASKYQNYTEPPKLPNLDE